ncbi:Fc.00g035000.m01.CDS01 [Cosmosporella sp. VM-42]
MDERVAHSPFTENDIGLDTPQLSIELALGAKLTENSYCHVLVTIQRRDSYNKPCIFSWSQRDSYGVFAGFLLFRHTEGGLLKIEIDDDLPRVPDVSFLVDGWKRALLELAPGGRTRFMATMPKRYRKELVTGSRYELVWPGDEFGLWDWGTIEEHIGQDLSVKSSKIYLPRAQATLEFGKFGRATERQGSPPPITPSERIPGAPTLSVSLECEKEAPLYGIALVMVNVVYEAPPESPPIIFHTYPFISWWGPREGYRLYRRQGDLWKTIQNDTTGFMIVDDPDVKVNVSEDENFASLRAGQSWTTSMPLEGRGYGMLPDDLKVGDVYRYSFKGAILDWWDWGSKEEHTETTVTLPCYVKGMIVEPKDNGGRPRLLVPGSNSVEFTIV